MVRFVVADPQISDKLLFPIASESFTPYCNSFHMKYFSSVSTFWLLWSTANGQPNDAPTGTPSPLTDSASFVPTMSWVPVSSPVPMFQEDGGIQSDKCQDNAACAALGNTGLCCPTTDRQFLYCCGGRQQATCASNDRCANIGLTGTCCPTAGYRRPKLNGIYLDCCDRVPNACAISGDTNGTVANTTNSTATNSSSCVQKTAVEFLQEVASAESSSRSRFMGLTLALISSVGVSVLG
jgi:hypothetical protein